MNWQTGEKTFVSRLRVGRTGLDPLTARLRLNALFQAADVQPAGLSPAAIVCIRRLHDPRPRTISLARGHSHLPPEWQESARAAIENLVRRAPHPAREFVSANEPCVVFADRAELLAAIADDWCERRAMTRWWWQSLFKQAFNSAALVKLWQQSPEYVPGALEHLARRDRAARFVAALPDDSARALLFTLTSRFALFKLASALSAMPQTGTHAGTQEQAGESWRQPSLSGVAQENSRASSGETEPPWRRLAPESDAPELSLPQQCLLGVGLSLQRAPAQARSINFAYRAGAWINARSLSNQAATVRDASAPGKTEPREASSTHRIDSASKTGDAPARGASEEREAARAQSRISKFDVVQSLPAPEVSDANIDSSKPGDARASASLLPPTPTHDVATAGPDDALRVAASDVGLSAGTGEVGDGDAREVESIIEDGESEPRLMAREAQAELPESVESLAPLQESEAETHARPALIAHIETRYGGLFHLVNLALFLELYGDFTTPSEPGIALSIWDFVAMLGRRLGGEGVEIDPIWPLLAELAGRGEGQPPGEDFDAPDAWRVPVEWLRMFPLQDGWTWTTTQGADFRDRLQLIHPAKFLVLDVPLEGDAEEQLARELELYAGAFDGTPQRAARAYKLRGRDTNARWVERLHAFVRARLRRALGIVDARRAARLLCERHASVFVTTTHLDIVMRLAELPFEVRVAGLDRDPGWVPAAGRFIAFHFE